MANTYTQLYIHTVFAVNGRWSLIPKRHSEELYKFITGIVQHRQTKLLAVGGMPDHIHVFVGMNPSIALSDLVRDVKAASSRFVNKRGWVRGKFGWQKGYGAFSHSRSQVDAVCHYVRNQEQHHAQRSFKNEYLQMLRDFEVAYEDEYLFEWTE